MDDPDIPETTAIYLRLRGLPPTPGARRKKRRQIDDEHEPFTPGRDPQPLSDVVTTLSHQAGWDGILAREDIVRLWQEVVGAETAQHTRPLGLNDGVLAIECDSTAWAKQLGYMRANIVTELTRRFPEAGVVSIRFIGPDVPSWKWGPRAVPGRGPRDTYG